MNKLVVNEVLKKLRSNELIEVRIVNSDLGKSACALHIAKQLNKMVSNKKS